MPIALDFKDDTFLVPKNTSVIVRRVPVTTAAKPAPQETGYVINLCGEVGLP